VKDFGSYINIDCNQYCDSEHIKFNRTLLQDGVCINEKRTKITLSDAKYQRVSFGVDVSCVLSGCPKLVLFADDECTDIAIKANCGGWNVFEGIFCFAPCTRLSLKVVGGKIHLSEDGINAYISVEGFDCR